jgi:nicotinate dehydrogenase subunit A
MIDFTLNGQRRQSVAADHTALLDALRGELRLTATRFGCGVNQCGACHVLVDGVSVPACDTPMWSIAGKQVITVEGLGNAAAPHALQTALIEHQAGQCGYCLSGIQISAAALLARNPDPSDAEVRTALDRHLCRCGSHNRIVKAVLAAARSIRAQPSGDAAAEDRA